ncbi:MAG: hypothetical protein IKD69_02600 [Solobacterium sp.]|nr:hypothetical protein [Solobacterium sp.]
MTRRLNEARLFGLAEDASGTTVLRRPDNNSLWNSGICFFFFGSQIG